MQGLLTNCKGEKHAYCVFGSQSWWEFKCVRACMYVRVYVYIYIYIHTYMSIYICM